MKGVCSARRASVPSRNLSQAESGPHLNRGVDGPQRDEQARGARPGRIEEAAAWPTFDGGVGANLARVLGRYPAMRGQLFDLPHLVARARLVLESAGVWDRCAVTGGDFFTTAPAGADVYLLGHILHDWDDARPA